MARNVLIGAAIVVGILFLMYPELLFATVLFGVWLGAGRKKNHRGRRWGGYSGMDGRGFL